MPLVLALVQLQTRVEKQPREGLHDVGLVHDRDFLAAGRNRVVKSEFKQAASTCPGIDAGRHGHGTRVTVDRNVVFVPDVQSFKVLAHHHQVNLVKASARDDGLGGAQVGVELELFAQSHV